MSTAVVIASSGMDSTLVATKLAKAGHELALLHFTYGQRAKRNEYLRIKLIAKYFWAKLKIIDLDGVGHIRRSSLDAEANVEVGRGRIAAKVAMEWVPARNMVFLAYGIAFAQQIGADVVALGVNQEEALAIPDNEQALYDEMNGLGRALGWKNVKVETPIGALMKEDIVRQSFELGSPLHFTWSCYQQGDKPCGECGSCTQRREAFKRVGRRDPILPLSEIERLIQKEA